jgi:hypothetical protein
MRLTSKRFLHSSILLCWLTTCFLSVNAVHAGGGVVMTDGQCTMHIDFYSARFTAYQPETRGNKEFCKELPDIGTTIFVLSYLHPTLKEVPVDFRIVRNVTGLGRFTKWRDIESLGDIAPFTVFYQQPEIRPDGSLNVEYDFINRGEYIGIVTAGHPTNDKLYTAVFPFEVGVRRYWHWLVATVLLAGAAFYFWRRRSTAGRARGFD